MAFDVEKIEDRIDKAETAALPVSAKIGGVDFANALQIMEFAKMMAIAKKSVPPHLRGEPGACLAVVMQAVEWRMSPFAVANKSYEVNDRIAYESQLIHAVIEARAPLKKRLRCQYEGDGDSRRIIVIGHLKGEDEPFLYTSPTVGEIKSRLGKNQSGNLKGSPLWVSDPDQQLWYYGSRAWARKWCPDVIMGIYSIDELDEEIRVASATDITPPKPPGAGIASRLAASKDSPSEGFNTEHVRTEMAQITHAPGETLNNVAPPAKELEPVAEEKTQKRAPAKSAAAPKPEPVVEKDPAPEPEPKPEPKPEPEVHSKAFTTFQIAFNRWKDGLAETGDREGIDDLSANFKDKVAGSDLNDEEKISVLREWDALVNEAIKNLAPPAKKSAVPADLDI